MTPVGRGRSVLFGAAAGFLAAAALIAPDLAGPFGQHFAITFVVGVVAGVLVGALSLWRLAGWIAVAIALLALIVIATPVTDALVAPLVRTDSMPSHLDAIVVLGGGVTASDVLPSEATDRMLSGLELARRTQPRLFITTRVVAKTESGRVLSSDDDQRTLIALAGDTAIWRVTGRVATTRDEALETSAILPPGAAGLVAVVTSPTHTRRACATFEKVGYRVVCVPSVPRSHSVLPARSPSERLHAFFGWIYERLGLIKYRAHGWIA